jgi:hypothetical protein
LTVAKLFDQRFDVTLLFKRFRQFSLQNHGVFGSDSAMSSGT